MSRRKTAAISLLLCCALGCGAIWMIPSSTARGHSQAGTDSTDAPSNPLARINGKARVAKSGDEAAIRALADEMFSMFGFDSAPAGMDDAIKERLVRAELRYRNGHGKGSSEFQVVHMVNKLADKLNAPAYAHTNVFEVKRLRAGWLLHVPDLLLHARDEGDDKGEGRKRNASGNPILSPLEAFFVAVSLVQQKRFNEEYQLTHDEWAALHGGKRSDKAHKRFRAEIEARRGNSTRADEMERAIESGFASMSPSQIFKLPENLLNTLGVER